MNAIGRLDWIGLALWSGMWLAYAVWASRAVRTRPNLMAAVDHHRLAWMRQSYLRDNRITDSAIIGNLMQSANFFSSTTLLFLGGLFAFLGNFEQGAQLLQSLPFSARASQALLEVKALMLTLVFVYAFLRFTWSLRQFNLVCILIGSFPVRREDQIPDDPLVEQAARMNVLAGLNFSQGLRAYYFSVPLLLWILNPWLMIAGSVGITAVTFMMEFRSPTVAALTRWNSPPDQK
jgi:uncharacterized membrane protein